MNDAQTPQASANPTADSRNGQPASLADRVRSLRLPDRPVRPQGRSSWFPWLCCLLALGAAGYMGWQLRQTQAALSEQADEPTEAAVSTSSFPTTPNGSGKAFLETGGYLLPVRRVQISPKVGGQVIKLFYEEGEYVKEGEPLAHIDRTKYDFNYREKKAQADMLLAEHDRMKASIVLQEKKGESVVAEARALLNELLSRKTYLVNAQASSQTAVTEEEITSLQYQIEQAEEKVRQFQRDLEMTRELGPRDVERAWQNYLQAKVVAENAKDDLDNTIVLAPSSGIILKKYAEEGNMVRPEAFSNGLSASLYDMADLTKMEVDVDISESDLSFVREGMRCEIRLEADPERLYKGHVSRRMPEADRSKAAVSARVRIEVPEGDTLIRPELRARVRFMADDKPAS